MLRSLTLRRLTLRRLMLRRLMHSRLMCHKQGSLHCQCGSHFMWKERTKESHVQFYYSEIKSSISQTVSRNYWQTSGKNSKEMTVKRGKKTLVPRRRCSLLLHALIVMYNTIHLPTFPDFMEFPGFVSCLLEKNQIPKKNLQFFLFQTSNGTPHLNHNIIIHRVAIRTSM